MDVATRVLGCEIMWRAWHEFSRHGMRVCLLVPAYTQLVSIQYPFPLRSWPPRNSVWFK